MNENDIGSSQAAAKDQGAEQKSTADLEWEQRTLCSDESCIGVIGPDGRCKVCGKPFAGFQGAESEPAEPAASEPEAIPEDAAPTAPDPGESEQISEADNEWEQRILCRDESCIGVIGPDGRCKECGKPYEQS